MATNSSSLSGGNSASSFGIDGQPVGNDFKDPILVAAIVVNGICTISFGVLVIATWNIKRKKEKGRRLFGVVSSIITGMFLSYLKTTGDEIAQEFNQNQRAVFIALVVVDKILSTGTDTALPFVIYRVVKNRLCYIKNDATRYSALHYTHLGIAGLIVVIGVADAFLAGYGQIFVDTDSREMVYGLDATNWYRNLHMTYTTVYCAAALDMFACAVFIFNKSRPANTHDKIPLYLLTMVTPFLIIRAAVNVAFAVLYVYLLHDQQESFGVIKAALLGFPSIVLYAGLVLIGLSQDWNMRPVSIFSGDVRQDPYGPVIASPQYGGVAKQPAVSTVQRY